MPDNLNSFKRNGSFKVSDLETVAEDYDKVSQEFLNEISGMDSMTENEFKSYAKQFKLPGQYVQRFVDDAFVYSIGNDFKYIPVDFSLDLHSYNWDNLTHYGSNEKDYVVNGKSRASKCIDVSYAQGDIDWDAVKADGVDYAFIRLGVRYGVKATMEIDKKFHQNMRNAQAAGVKVGVYFYSQAINVAEAREEARFVLDALEGYDLDLPVAFDIEGGESAAFRAFNLSTQTATNICLAFMDTIKDAGQDVMLYTYAKYASEHLDMSQLQHYDLWMAQYYRVPFFPYDFHIWQYSGSGRVAGIKGNVDMNLIFKDYNG